MRDNDFVIASSVSDAAIQTRLDCFASLAMTESGE